MPFQCRICHTATIPILSLGNLPLANALLKKNQLTQTEQRFPLDVVLCPQCSLLQITETVSPQILFEEYPYFSSYSDTMLIHAQHLAETLTATEQLTPNSLVLEAASNDGYLLQYFLQKRIPVLGIEPARNIAQVARAKNIPTINEFFDEQVALRLANEGKMADIFVANNVLAHVANLHNFVEGVRLVLKPTGLGIFESAYVCKTIDGFEFDQIYHEHLCYYSLTALTHLFAAHALCVVDAEILPIHGGSIRIYVKHQQANQPQPRLLNLETQEKLWGVAHPTSYEKFAASVNEQGLALTKLLQEIKHAGMRVAAYGASAKGSIMLNTFNIGGDLIEYVVDRSPHKQGLFMPGVHLPIYAPEYLLEDKPEYALMLAWNFKDEVLKQMHIYQQNGGKFIIPIPKLEIV